MVKDSSTAYVYGPGGLPLEQISGSTVLWLHHDQLGSTRLATDSSGSNQATYTYDAYGNLTASTGTITNPLRFAGQYQDAESGLYYLRARYYDPSTGQFLSRDPAVATTRDPYAYTYDNPLNLTDPTGLLGFDDLKHMAGAAAGAIATGIGAAHDDFAVPVAKAALSYAAETAGACASRTLAGIGQCSLNVALAVSVVAGGEEVEVGGLVIGRTADLLAKGALREGEYTLLPQLVGDLGSPAANWARNAGVLRAAIRGCNAVRDASPGDTGGAFLSAERDLLANHGFSFDEATSMWTR